MLSYVDYFVSMYLVVASDSIKAKRELTEHGRAEAQQVGKDPQHMKGASMTGCS